MAEDVKNPEFSGVREFFVKNSKSVVNYNKPSFQYHTDIHPDLVAAISFLQELKFIEDITPGNCPMYRLKEHFVDQLRNR